MVALWGSILEGGGREPLLLSGNYLNSWLHWLAFDLGAFGGFKNRGFISSDV